MITAVDTTVLLDLFSADPTFGPRSREAVGRCVAEGSLIACEAVWAEVAAAFPLASDAEEALGRVEVRFSAMDRSAALAAGEAWRSYRRGGGARQRVIADFLIGAHALAQADRLLTRDRGFYRRYFRELQVLDPAGD